VQHVRVRIAPSPTGDPHVGTAYIALFNYAYARQQGGKFILRIEDTDRARSTLQSEADIFASLRWLGLHWDEGPDIGGPYGPYRQSERLPIYQRYASELMEKGHAYRCFCTPERLAEMRREQEARGLPTGYDRHCLRLTPVEVDDQLAAGVPYVVRLKVPDAGETTFGDIIRGDITFQNNKIDDQVLLKSDGFPTYHLANVVDDHLMGITLVCRAEEWLSSVPKHVLLYQAFGWDIPQYAHMPLLRNTDRSKISKRKNPTSLHYYRDHGYLPEAMLNFLALLGYSMPDGREFFSLDEFVQSFSWDRVVTSGPIFNLAKLDDINGKYIRALPPSELQLRLEPFLPPGAHPEYVGRIVPVIQDRLKRLGEFEELFDFFFVDRLTYDSALLLRKGLTPAQAVEILRQAVGRLSGLVDWSESAIIEALDAIVASLGLKRGDVFMIVRVAVTGKTETPPLDQTMAVLGRERCVARLQEAIAMLEQREASA
jgi:glutamyl-tRNA synthetase